MKNLYKKIVRVLPVGFIAISAALAGCEELKFGNEFLNQQPEQIGINMDTVFSKKYYAMQVLTKAYTTLPYGIPAGSSPKLGGDLLDALTPYSYSKVLFGGSRSKYYNGTYSSSTEGTNSKYDFTNNNIWNGIRYAWLTIENIDRVPDMTSVEKDRAKAEAKMIIATHYADMFRNYGGILYLDHAISVDEEHYFKRLTVEESVNTIVGLIDQAKDDLEWRVSDPNDDGRMTKAYALGLKLRVLLFAASPLFNSDQPYLEGKASDERLTWYGNYDVNRWKAAEDAGREFMTALAENAQYDLVQATENTPEAYRKAFRDAYFTRGNSEVLLSVRKGYTNSYANNFNDSQNAFASKQCPTLAYANLFPMENGTDFPADFNWANPDKDPFEGRDPRFYETILTNGRPYNNRTAELWVGGRDRTEAGEDGTGLMLYKFIQDYTAATSIGQVDSWPAMRLAEVYLSYAEAINEANGAPTPEAYRLVNEVRNRVGLGDLTDTSMTKDEFRKAVLRERACEFGYEEVIWYDIVRWKNEEAFKADIQGVNTFKDSSNPTGFHYEIFTISPNRAWKDQWSPKWYLSAFPKNEMDKNYGLVQNPGW